MAVWELWVYVVERFDNLPDSTMVSTALHTALTTINDTNVFPKMLHQALRGVERLIMVEKLSLNSVEVVLKLVMDLALHSNPLLSLAVLPLFVTALHSSTRATPQHLLAEDPELLVQFMEKLSIIFDRIRVGFPYEAEILAGLLSPCLLTILPPGQILNKVITEFISSHQPYPHLIAVTLFKVFEKAMADGCESLVHDWVLLSLSNFSQRTPTSLAVWCLTCFFIAASNDTWLRAAFPCVQSRLGKLEDSDIELFCLAACHFRNSLPSEREKGKFDDVFRTASGAPFQQLLQCIEKDRVKTC